MNDKYDALKIENQVCFPLYASAKEIVKRYQPLLTPLGLTYTQYITMMVLWEKQEVTMKNLGKILYLDSGTLTPVLKKMEAKGYILRSRSKDDERNVNVLLTPEGETLKERALSVPFALAKCVNLTEEEAVTLYGLLHKVLAGMEND